MASATPLTSLVALMACFVAVITDLRLRRIPNQLTVIAAALGLCAQLIEASGLPNASMWQAALNALGAGLFAFASCYLLSLWGVLGFGDTKLVGALGICLGWPLVIRMLVCTLLSGGAVAIVYGVATRQLGSALGNLLSRRPLTSGRIDEPGHQLHEMPYGLAIALGTLWTVAIRYYPSLSPLP